MSTSWRITCFDSIQASDGTQVVTTFPSVPAKLLVASLALRPGELVPRDILCERLWPEAELDRQRARFRWTLSQLRKALSPELFVSSGNSAVGLAPGTTSDVAEFDAHIRASFRPNFEKETLRELLQRAEGLHKEGFLVGMAGEWVESERERRVQQLDELRKRAAGELEKTPPDSLPPRENDRFFGRTSEQQLLTSFARSDQRLLTVTGTGGLGKTRLVREALLSEALLFVPMAALTDAGSLFDLLRELLKLPASGYGPVQERVTEHLKTRGKTLLLLDNAEQIAEGLAPLVETLLVQCPNLQLVVTSRRRLKLEGEQVLKLEPLPQRTAEDLFLARAQATNPRFATTKGGQAQVGAICKLLEGIPLALEIAAARALLVSPTQMHQELATRLRFLVRLRGAEARQLSVRAALEWSYELLSPQARLAFRRSGVFRGGFTLAAARFVFGDEPPALDAIQELIDHSLLKSDYQNDGETETERYTQLEVVRELAELLLKTIPTDYEDARAYHADFFLLHARRIGESVKAGNWATAIIDIKDERNNLNTASVFAVINKNCKYLTEISYSLAIPYLEIGYWDDIDYILFNTQKLLDEKTESGIIASIITWRSVIFRRKGEYVESWNGWVKARDLHLKNNDIYKASLSCIELVSQAIDENRIDIASEYIAILDKADNDNNLFTNEKLKWLILHARLANMKRNKDLALCKARIAQKFAEDNVVSDSMWLLVVSYLVPIFRDCEELKTAKILLDKYMYEAFLNRNYFVLGILVHEMGMIASSENDYMKEIQSFWIASMIHRELGSRHVSRSEKYLLAAQEKWGNLSNTTEWLKKANANGWMVSVKDLILMNRTDIS